MIIRIVMYKKLEIYISDSKALLEVIMVIIKRVLSKTLKGTGIYINKQIEIFIELSAT